MTGTLRAWVLGLVVTAWVTLPSSAEVNEDRRYIEVEGSAFVSVEPDVLVWVVWIEARGPDPKRLREAFDQQVEALRDASDDADIDDADLTVGRPALTVEDDAVARRYVYRAKSVAVQRDVDELDDALEAWVESGLRFDVAARRTDEEQLRDGARRDAVASAHDKATAMAESLDARVGRPLRVTAVRDADGAGPPFLAGWKPGAIDIVERVVVRFELE